MKQQDLSALTDQELLDKAKRMKYNPVVNALLIGVMIGVIVYSILKSTIGLLTLIPLVFIFKLVNKGEEKKAIEKELTARNLKL